MNFFPTSRRDRWLLLLFPFKTYVFVAPAFFLIWDIVSSGHRFPGERRMAMDSISACYIMCFLVFATTTLLLCIFLKFDLALTTGILALLSFFSSVLMTDHFGLLVVITLFWFIAFNVFRPRPVITVLASQNETAFTCPVCATRIPGHAQKCPHCSWTYLA
ncbi:MAG TPA: hypothetical protein VHC44_15160 [Verrucomicrobiae bacterium]|nr:hypothetical protein [Verrucomicrobiae bacterium]